jgi:hypothetical protein
MFCALHPIQDGSHFRVGNFYFGHVGRIGLSCVQKDIRLKTLGIKTVLRLKSYLLTSTMNSYGTLFRITTFGESHGPSIGVIIDGCPAGLSNR